MLGVCFQCTISYGVRTGPVRNRMHQHLCTLAATRLFGHTKILNTLIGMGSAVPAAVVPYRDTGDPNFPQRTMKYEKNTKILFYFIFLMKKEKKAGGNGFKIYTTPLSYVVFISPRL